MRVIPVMSTKGGVGKSKVCVGLGRALKAKGFHIGFLDVDWVAPNLHLELGVDRDSGMKLSQEVGDIIQPVLSPEGFLLVSSAFLYPPDQAISMDEDSKIRDIEEISAPGVVAWGEVDYLLMDTPPTTARFVQTALAIDNLYGVVLVCQPAGSAIADLYRTVSLLKDLHIPIIGLVGNQVHLICPHGEKINLFDMGESELVVFCETFHIPYLGSIPHVVPSMGLPPLDGITDRMLSGLPIYLPKDKTSNLPYKLLVALARRKKEGR